MSDQKTGPVVVIGDALIDEIRSDNATAHMVGGAALNVAVGLSRLGVETRLIAMVGDDTDGATIRAFLEEHKVQLIPTIGPNGSSRGVSERINGEPFYVFNAAAQARKVEFGPAELEAISNASLVVVSCFPFDDVQQSEQLLAAIDDPKLRLVVDPNPREKMMHSTARFRETFDRLAPHSLLIKVGDDDASLLYGASIDELTDHLIEIGASAVLGTAGRDGAAVRTADGTRASVPIAQLPGSIVDTMGAGDATLASVIQSILHDGFPADANRWERVIARAMLIAAATCRAEGALLQIPSVLSDR